MKMRLSVDASEDGVTAIGLGGKRKAALARGSRERGLAKRWRAAAESELGAYFAGRERSFSTPCDLRGLRGFTRAVLEATAKIPYGEVRSYEWVARRVGKPKAARAVGNALARNPIPIIIPCHRVVRSDGSIGGFTLGAAWKKKLLTLEGALGRRATKCQQHSSSRARLAATNDGFASRVSGVGFSSKLKIRDSQRVLADRVRNGSRLRRRNPTRE